MLAPRRLSGRRLAELCHRLAISAESGIDIRKTWRREAENATGSLSAAYEGVRDGISRGETLSESLARTGGLFPSLFLEMVHIGEQTGSLAEVLRRLSDHYQRQAEMSRGFRAGLAWPLMQLAAAIVIIGIMIGVFGALDVRRLNGDPIDLLGFGVTGGAALLIYIQMIVGLVLLVAGVIFALRRGVFWVRPIQRLLMATPAIGPCLEKICLARMAWVLHLTLNVEIDLRRIVPLALRATGADYYARWSKPVTGLVAAGQTLHEAFRATGVFPAHFIDSLEVAEESGQIVESMARLSRHYEEEAQSAMRTLTRVLGFFIGAGVLLLIGAMVVRLFQVIYLDALNDALNF